MSRTINGDLWRKAVPVVAIIALVLGLSYFAYDRWIDVPYVTYEVLPSYRLPPPLDEKRVVIVTISNSGLARATEVRISIRTTGPVEGLEIDSGDEVLPGQWQNRTTLTITMPRLVQGNQVSITILVSSKSAPVEDVQILFDQGMGSQKTSSESWLDFMVKLFAIPGAVFMIAIVIAVLETLWKSRPKPITSM